MSKHTEAIRQALARYKARELSSWHDLRAICTPENVAALLAERDALLDALVDVLRTSEAEARAIAAEKVARENFTADAYEIRALERAMVAASEAEKRARDAIRKATED